ncbi:hypothetical protein FACS1894190_17270 [Spirochaetia bacterium]|nr:hypothetical protein FACS1894190_17270 [Spirochaetia bacterium]
MLSAALDKKVEVGKFALVVNSATSFVRDQIIDFIPLVSLLPRPNPKDLKYQINEIDQEAFNQYLLKKENNTSAGIVFLGILLAVPFGLIIFVVNLLCYFIFMGKFKNSHPFATFILCIGLIVASIIIINYNSGGLFSLYLLATILIGIGLSWWDSGSDSNKSGIEKQKNEDYKGAVSDFAAAIKSAPYNATYIYNRGVSYAHLQEWGKAIVDLTDAVRLNPKNARFKKDLEYAQAQVSK